MSSFAQPMIAPISRVMAPTTTTTVCAVGRSVEDRVGAGDQVDAGGHHRGCVDQRGHRRRALHRVEQPGLQRELRRLAARAEQQSRPSQVIVVSSLAAARRAKTPSNVTDPKVTNMSMIATDRPTSPTRLTMNAFLRGDRGDRLLEPEPDQQVRRQADALPADVQQQVVVGEDQQQHRGDEQVEVAEEPAPLGVVLHVADRVDVDQRADAGDQQDEDDRQRVEQQATVDVERRRPGSSVQVLVDRAPGVRLAEQREEQDHAR